MDASSRRLARTGSASGAPTARASPSSFPTPPTSRTQASPTTDGESRPRPTTGRSVCGASTPRASPWSDAPAASVPSEPSSARTTATSPCPPRRRFRYGTPTERASPSCFADTPFLSIASPTRPTAAGSPPEGWMGPCVCGTRTVRGNRRYSEGTRAPWTCCPSVRRVASLASGAFDSTVRVWDVDAPGDPVAVLAQPSAVHSVSFSRDGRFIAAGATDRAIRNWNANGQGEPVIFHGHTDGVWRASSAPTAASSRLRRTRRSRIWTDLARLSPSDPPPLAGHQLLPVRRSHEGTPRRRRRGRARAPRPVPRARSGGRRAGALSAHRVDDGDFAFLREPITPDVIARKIGR